MLLYTSRYCYEFLRGFYSLLRKEEAEVSKAFAVGENLFLQISKNNEKQMFSYANDATHVPVNRYETFLFFSSLFILRAPQK